MLFRTLRSLSIPPQIQRWIFQFFTGRQQAVISGGQQYKWLPITRSVVQGSGIGPSAYLVYSMDLKALSSYNSILKYADDTSILVPQHSSISIEEEFQNVQTWSIANKLQINLRKTKEIVFRRPSARNFITPQPLYLPLNSLQLLNFWEYILRLPFLPLYMLSIFCLLRISDYIYCNS